MMMMNVRINVIGINRFPNNRFQVTCNLLYAAMETADLGEVKNARRCGVGGQVGGEWN